jgi:hypothetical protein
MGIEQIIMDETEQRGVVVVNQRAYEVPHDVAMALLRARDALQAALPHYKISAIMGDTKDKLIADKIMDAIRVLK